MRTVEPKWNADGLKTQLPAYLQDLRAKLSSMKGDAEKKDQQELVDSVNYFLEQKTSLKKTYPNVTFQDHMDVSLGKYDVRILHARTITIGTSYDFLSHATLV